jgi:hypothetical protein
MSGSEIIFLHFSTLPYSTGSRNTLARNAITSFSSIYRIFIPRNLNRGTVAYIILPADRHKARKERDVPLHAIQTRNGNGSSAPLSFITLPLGSERPASGRSRFSPDTLWTGIAQSVWGFATGWTVRGSNPGGGEIFLTRPDRSWGPSSLLYNGYLVFPGGKVAGAWRWPPTPSTAEVKERVQLHLYSPVGLCGLL